MLVVYILKSVPPRPQNTAVKFGGNALADPDPHYFGKMDSDPDPHYSEKLDTDRIRIKINIQKLWRLKWSRGGPWTLTMEA